jgi:hypothetical protein
VGWGYKAILKWASWFVIAAIAVMAVPSPRYIQAGPHYGPVAEYTVNGLVTLKSGSASQGRVDVYTQLQQESVASTPIQPDGSYSLSLDPGNYRLEVVVDGYYPKTELISLSGDLTVNFDLASADPYVIVGSVTGLSQLTDAHWQTLWARAMASNQYGPGMSANAQPIRATGVFTMHMPAGAWRVHPPQVAGFVTPSPQVAEVSADLPSITLPAFAFVPGHTISGTVTIDGSPAPPWQGHVDAFDSASGAHVAGTPVGQGGSYALTLGAGSYVVRAQLSGASGK